MNDITKTDQGKDIQNLQASYFEQYAAATTMNPIRGTLLKFNKGDWLLGSDEEEIPAGTRYTAVMDELEIGWVKWQDGKPVAQHLGKLGEGYAPPKRDALGDDDESLWDVDANDKPRDPWQRTNVLILRPVGTDGSDEGTLVTFSSSSKGGIGAVGELCKEYGKMMRQRPDEYPVIELQTDSYKHSNAEYGRIKTPVLKVVDWEPKVPVKALPPKTEAKGKGDGKPAKAESKSAKSSRR